MNAAPTQSKPDQDCIKIVPEISTKAVLDIVKRREVD
jgi:hypothetical protein